jgi:hypothetical protein
MQVSLGAARVTTEYKSVEKKDFILWISGDFPGVVHVEMYGRDARMMVLRKQIRTHQSPCRSS